MTSDNNFLCWNSGCYTASNISSSGRVYICAITHIKAEAFIPVGPSL